MPKELGERYFRVTGDPGKSGESWRRWYKGLVMHIAAWDAGRALPESHFPDAENIVQWPALINAGSKLIEDKVLMFPLRLSLKLTLDVKSI